MHSNFSLSTTTTTNECIDVRKHSLSNYNIKSTISFPPTTTTTAYITTTTTTTKATTTYTTSTTLMLILYPYIVYLLPRIYIMYHMH